MNDICWNCKELFGKEHQFSNSCKWHMQSINKYVAITIFGTEYVKEEKIIAGWNVIGRRINFVTNSLKIWNSWTRSNACGWYLKSWLHVSSYIEIQVSKSSLCHLCHTVLQNVVTEFQILCWYMVSFIPDLKIFIREYVANWHINTFFEF